MVIVSGGYDFSGAFDDIFVLKKNKNLPFPIADHPDTNLFTTQDTAFLYEKTTLKSAISKLGYNVVTVKNPQNSYPYDAALNCLLTEEIFLCNEKTVAKEILAHIKKSGKKIVSCNQGYCACSTLYIGNNAFITADRGIKNALEKAGQIVLEISSGGIALEGYDYGFIGGTAGFVDDTLYFCGNIRTHQDFKKIDEFLKRQNVSYCCFPGVLTDVGGIKQIQDLNNKDELLYL